MIAFTKHIVKFSFVLVAVLGNFVIANSLPDDTPENYIPRDTVFEEIILTDEGITAIDTAGYEWYYDFENSVFIAGTPPLTEDGIGIPEPPESEYSGIPIEDRATIKKKLKHFESGTVTVRADEFVDGNINALNMVTIKGWVRGDVVSINDRVLITESGQVDGNVTAPEVIVKEGGIVLGDIIESEVPLDFNEFTTGFSHDFLLVMVIMTVSFLFAGFIQLTLIPKKVANLEACIMNHKKRSFFLGLLLLLVLPALIVLVAITIIGIVLIPIIPLVYCWAIILGIVATGRGLITPLYKKFIGDIPSPIILGIFGIMFIMSPWIITGALMGNEGGTAFGFGVFFLVVSIIFTTFPIFAGIGAAFLTRFGFRTYSSAPQFGPKPSMQGVHTPAPPPIPETPFVQKNETPPTAPRIPD